jgi:amino acid transporter
MYATHYYRFMKLINPTEVAAKRYKIQVAITMGAYCAILIASVDALNRFYPLGLLRYALILAPLVPVALLVPAVVRYFRESDELERRIVTEAFAIGAAVTAMLSVTYGFLENAGLPHLSAWWTWTVVMGASLAARLLLNRQYR